MGRSSFERSVGSKLIFLMEKVDDAQVVVSIQCLAYNHEKYIRQCLDGFIRQKTDFRFEAIVHDDASTDGTARIIKEYADKYPDIIKPIFETENQYSKRDGGLQRIMDHATRGKYVAICEGDDYWTDPYKLQKQVDYMEMNTEYAMCFTGAKVIAEIDNGHADLFRDLETREYSGDEIISGWIVPTCTVLYKKDVMIPIDKRFIVGDNVIFLSCAKFGKIHCISEQTAVYRQNAGGWTATHTGCQVLYKWLNHYMALFEYFPEFKKPIKDQIMKTYARLFFNRILHHDIIGIKFLIQGFDFGRLKFIPILVSLYKERKSKGQP